MRRRNRIVELAALAMLFALPTTGDAQNRRLGGDIALPLALPERPFLLIEAPRRFLSTERPEVRVQLADGGSVQLAVFRANDPLALVMRGRSAQGIAIAQTPMGRDAEALVAGSGSLPRAGRLVTLVEERRVELDVTRRPRRIGDETEVYDSNEGEENNVATWGVRTDGWADERVALGRLSPGLYLVRAHMGPYAATCLLSVGETVLLARRGDTHDTVLVTGAEGAPVPAARVEAYDGQRLLAAAATDATGRARFAASDTSALRFVVRRGQDIAWADVTHARLAECDPLVYLGVDRPVFRADEIVHLRGNVRGCARSGYAPISNEPVTLFPTRGSSRVTTIRTDASGNFIAELLATGDGIRARVRGHDHVRTIQIDHRPLPERTLTVTPDKPWAAGGETVGVEVADEEGGWPSRTMVSLETPAGRLSQPIDVRHPARFTFRMPRTREALERVTLTATVGMGSRVTIAAAELWTGRIRDVLHVTADRAWAAANETLPIAVHAEDLGGAPQAGEITLALRPSDGNRALGAPIWSGAARTDASGKATARVPLRGAGPWMIEARKRAASATLVVWDRPRPAQLSERGEIAVQPRELVAMPGHPLDVDVRLAPGTGAAWLSLEQGSVWASTMVTAPPVTRATASGHVAARLEVPTAARGLASVVMSRIHRGQIVTATSAVEVLTSKALHLEVGTDQRVYREGANAHVTIRSRGDDGRARDAVVSLWLADAGYWDLGQEQYPMPGEYFSLPGRRASAGDSTRPIAFGAEEGRHVDALLEWNGARVAASTFRHAWGYGGDLVSVQAQGNAHAVATAIARAAGLSRAEVCGEAQRRAGRVRLRARALPWDLVALKVARELETEVEVQSGVLRFYCTEEGGGLGMSGAGGGGGGSGYGSGMGAGVGGSRAQRLEGTLYFVGLRRIGPSGLLALDVPMPRHPGRWRIEVLAIADDGGGDRKGTVVQTNRALVAAIDAPEQLGPGDSASAVLRVRAPALGGRPVSLRLELPDGVALAAPAPATLTLGRDGTATTRVTLRGDRASQCSDRARPCEIRFAASAGAISDSVRQRLRVRAPGVTQPLALRAALGPHATDVHVPLPRLAAPARLHITVDAGLAASIEEVLEALDEPRWNIAAMRLDRLEQLASLARAAEAIPAGAARDRLHERIARALRGEHAALREHVTPASGVGWWSTLPSSTWLTAESVWYARSVPGAASTWTADAEALAARARSNDLETDELAVTAAALASTGRSEHVALARRLLDRIPRTSQSDLETDMWRLRAATALHEAPRIRVAAERLAHTLEAAIAGRAAAVCVGPAWFLCFARWGERGRVAAAASALLDGRHATGRTLAARAMDWLARWPAETGWWTWGTAEADVLELMARLAERQTARPVPVVTVDGRRVSARATQGGWELVVPRAADVMLSFAAAPGRATRVRVDSLLTVAAPDRAQGTVALERSLVGDARTPSLRIVLTLDHDQRDVEIGVPLGAGMLLAQSAGRRPQVRFGGGRWQSWADVSRPTDLAPRPVVESHEGELRLRFEAMRQGRYEVTVPLVGATQGDFGIAPAWLRARDPRVWALVPATRAHID